MVLLELSRVRKLDFLAERSNVGSYDDFGVGPSKLGSFSIKRG